MYAARESWILDFHDQAGRRHWETYRSPREAKEALSVRLEQLRKGTYHAPREIPTVRRVADAWLVAKRDRRPSTVAGNENYVSAHIGRAWACFGSTSYRWRTSRPSARSSERPSRPGR